MIRLLIALTVAMASLTGYAIPHDVPYAGWRPKIDQITQESARYIAATASISSLFSRISSSSFISECDALEKELRALTEPTRGRSERLRNFLIKYGFDPLNIISEHSNERYRRTLKDSLILISGVKNKQTPREAELVTVNVSDPALTARVIALAQLLNEFQITPIRNIHFLFLTDEKPAAAVFKELSKGKFAPIYSSNTVLKLMSGGPYVNYLGNISMRVQLEAQKKWKKGPKFSPAEFGEAILKELSNYKTPFQRDTMTPFVTVSHDDMVCHDSLLTNRCTFSLRIESRSRLTLSDTQGEVLALIADTHQRYSGLKVSFPKNVITQPAAYNGNVNRSVIAWGCTLSEEESESLSARFISSDGIYTAQNAIPTLTINPMKEPQQKQLVRLLHMLLILSGISLDNCDIAPIANISVTANH